MNERMTCTAPHFNSHPLSQYQHICNLCVHCPLSPAPECGSDSRHHRHGHPGCHHLLPAGGGHALLLEEQEQVRGGGDPQRDQVSLPSIPPIFIHPSIHLSINSFSHSFIHTSNQIVFNCYTMSQRASQIQKPS